MHVAGLLIHPFVGHDSFRLLILPTGKKLLVKHIQSRICTVAISRIWLGRAALSQCRADAGVTKRSRNMKLSRRDFVKRATSSGIALSFSLAASRPGSRIRRARNPSGTSKLESGRHRRGPHRRPRQGHRRQALRVRFSRVRPSRLAFEHVARLAHPSDGRDARLHRHRPLAAERCPRTVAGRHRRGSRGRRHPRARVLRGRSLLPGRKDAAVSRPAAGVADLRARSTPSIRRAWRCAIRPA